MENPEQSKRVDSQVKHLEQETNVKATVLRCSQQVLPGLMKKHDISEQNIPHLYWAIRGALVGAKATEEGELGAIVTGAVNGELNRLNLEKHRFAGEFQLAPKEEMQRISSSKSTWKEWPPSAEPRQDFE